MTMPFPYTLIKATFIARPNRFLAIILVNGNESLAHVADPGRLTELLIPGVTLWVDKAPDPNRKTQFTVRLVEQNNTLISIHTGLPNIWMEYSLKHHILPKLAEYDLVRREYPLGKHRFDFLLTKYNKSAILEVKSATLVENGLALFPDAPTVRGRSHVNTLSELSRQGQDSLVFFVIQRPDANSFTAHRQRDPKFADALISAEKAGVRILAKTCLISLTEISWGKSLPVVFS